MLGMLGFLHDFVTGRSGPSLVYHCFIFLNDSK